ncbi:hypothetical protein AYI68_g3470 [Smittium mucronatum]|uniref:Uncharacterized protein n=1 Tax=Smittium mucronatum TaxID=133383 RepID=A0A1R0GZV2_9FUNG|nr:hypothetical protein AYI68_g8300 [Smittium mucronatum]OLY82411.1 hypothetical protein AYI68_g3470 [Smittium mucronatum]
MEDLVFSLLRLLLSSGPSTPVNFSHLIPTAGAVQKLSVIRAGSSGRTMDMGSRRVIPALRSLLIEGDGCASKSELSIASSLFAQQNLKKEYLCLSIWYRVSASDTKKIIN